MNFKVKRPFLRGCAVLAVGQVFSESEAIGRELFVRGLVEVVPELRPMFPQEFRAEHIAATVEEPAVDVGIVPALVVQTSAIPEPILEGVADSAAASPQDGGEMGTGQTGADVGLGDTAGVPEVSGPVSAPAPAKVAARTRRQAE